MQTWRNPWWILLSGVFPVGILLALAGQIFYIISPQLSADEISNWYFLGSSLIALFLGQLGYFLYLRFYQKETNIWYTLSVFFVYLIWLFVYVATSATLVSSDIPAWMLPGEAFLYPFGFIMPNLAFSLYSLVAAMTNLEKKPSPWTNLGAAISIPAAIYLAVNIFFINSNFVQFTYFRHLGVVLMVGATVLFLFLLGRSVYILAKHKSLNWAKWQIVVKVVLSIVFPLWGLMLNNGDLNVNFDKIFGDFSDPWFYGLALCNGILFSLPNYPNPWYRLVLFAARSLCFTYIVYFALVFLPFLPLSIPAIIVFGTGFLMLTPVVLLIFQSASWIDDFQYLQQMFRKQWLVIIGVSCALVLPMYWYVNCMQDRATLHQVLNYVYQPNFEHTAQLEVSDVRLERVFSSIRENKKRSNWEPGSSTLPYLSHFYTSTVLDNLSLSDRKLNKLEAIFLSARLEDYPEPIPVRTAPKIKNAVVDSKWNELDQSWLSTVALEIENPLETLEEYRSTFELPDGALIKDYYLYIGKEKVKGELAEKKTATWIYEQIVNNSRRDPGILKYLDTRNLSLRVYPFQGNEVRKTGFTVIHKEAFYLTLDKTHELVLGDITKNSTLSAPIILDNGKLAYIPAAVEEKLPKVALAPHYHFIVDCSEQRAKDVDSLIAKIELLIRSRKYPTESLHFHLTNSQVITLPSNDNWQAAIRKQVKKGGFFAERAFEQILYQYATKPLKHYPVMVLVSEKLRPIMPEFAPHLAHSVYNGMSYAYLGNNFLETTGFLHKSEGVELSMDTISAKAYPNAQKPIAYLSNSSYVQLPGYQPSADLKKGAWESAALLQAEWQYQEKHPELGDEAWLSLIKKSFRTGILTSETAYLVLENESQRRMLQFKQQQVLNGKKELDLGEEPRQMSEPGLLLMLALLGLVLMRRRFRLRISKKNENNN